MSHLINLMCLLNKSFFYILTSINPYYCRLAQKYKTWNNLFLMRWSFLSIYRSAQWKTSIFELTAMHCGILFTLGRWCCLRTCPKRHLWRQNNNAETAWCFIMLSRSAAHQVWIWNRANMSACTPTKALTVAICLFSVMKACANNMCFISGCV